MSDKIDIDKFLAEHAQVPFQATMEPSATDATKVKVTPWTPDGGCACDAAIEVPKSVVDSVRATETIHWCCGKGLRVAEVTFKDTHADLLQSAFAALQTQATKARTASAATSRAGAQRSPWCNADCSAACGICAKTGKSGPCFVCAQCRSHGCPMTASVSDQFTPALQGRCQSACAGMERACMANAHGDLAALERCQSSYEDCISNCKGWS